jgi:hypothetical protein
MNNNNIARVHCDLEPGPSCPRLKQERGISLDELIVLLDENHILDVVEHSNKDKYGKQKIYVVNIGGYIYLVPFVRDGNKIFLKTIIPSRKATAQYLSFTGG